MRKIVLLIISILLTSNAVASSFDDAINLAKQEGRNKQSNSITLAKKFDPKTTFDNYSKSPEQTKYYDGIKQSNTDNLTNDALQSKNSDSGVAITNSINQHPQFVIKQSDPSIEHGKLLQSEADNIIHGVTSRYVDCKPKEACAIQYQQKQCLEAPQNIFQSCKKKLSIEIITHETVTHYPLKAYLSVKEHSYAGININTVSGRVDFLGPHDARFKLDGRLPANIDCHTLLGKLVAKSGNANLDSIHYPSCGNGLNFDYHISRGDKLDLQIDIASKVVTYEVKDHWVDDCSSIVADTSCKLKTTQCDIPNSTQVIQGIPITRDCWQQSFSYICRGGSGDGTCQPLRDQGCEQVNAVCKETTSNQCSLYQQTYRCPTQSCAPTTDVVCGNGQEYCLDGNCTDHSYSQSADFAKGVSALSAVAEAGKQFDQSSLTVFTGRSVECSEKPIGYSNCCTESGWGQDIGLDNCPESAKKLHVDRENKLAIKIGRYCSTDVLGVCVEHSQVFCVFGSKLAKIIQEQGRAGQLKLDFGSAKDPNCSGISIDQLQKLDLSKIDFQEFVTDLNEQIKDHDLKQIQDMIRQRVEQSQLPGKTYDK